MKKFILQIDNPGRAELRKFGLISGAIVVVLFGLLLPWLFEFQWPLWPWVFCGVFSAWGILLPDSLYPVYRGWMIFGQIAGWINTRIILALMFYLVFLPFAIGLRLLGKDPMARKLDDKLKTYRILSTAIDKDHIEKPY